MPHGRRVADGSDALRTRIVEDASGQPRCDRFSRGGRRISKPRRSMETSSTGAGSAAPARWRSTAISSTASWCALDDGRTGWYLNQHHLVADAWSTVLLVPAGRGAVRSRPASRRPAARLPFTATIEPSRRCRGATRRAGRRASTGTTAFRPGAAQSRCTAGRERQPEPPAPGSRSRSTSAARVLSRRAAATPGFSSLSESLSRFALFATLLVSWLHRIERRARARVRRAGCRAAYARGAADARRLHRDVPVRGRRRTGRHLQDACRRAASTKRRGCSDSRCRG